MQEQDVEMDEKDCFKITKSLATTSRTKRPMQHWLAPHIIHQLPFPYHDIHWNGEANRWVEMYTYRTGCYDVLILNDMVSQWKNCQGHVGTVEYIDIAHCFYYHTCMHLKQKRSAFEIQRRRFFIQCMMLINKQTWAASRLTVRELHHSLLGYTRVAHDVLWS